MYIQDLFSHAVFIEEFQPVSSVIDFVLIAHLRHIHIRRHSKHTDEVLIGLTSVEIFKRRTQRDV